MKKIVVILLLISQALSGMADRIYVMNSNGYNKAGPELITAIKNNGHTVVENNSSPWVLPSGFSSTLTDPSGGYDWLCFFGTYNFSGLASQIKSFIDEGGKVFYQYEVSCCTQSSSAVATILSSLTGKSISPNSNAFIAINSKKSAYTADGIGCCVSFVGNAYKGLDNLPVENQLRATSIASGSYPDITTCYNFGFQFATKDFVSSANRGAIMGLGDVNVWYDSDEPFWGGGTTPVNTDIVDYIFPNNQSTCYAFPPGYIDSTYTRNRGNTVMRYDTTVCNQSSLFIDKTTPNATYLWSDGSTNATLNITQSGVYWVDVTIENCTARDSIIVTFMNFTGSGWADTTLCLGDSLILNPTVPNASYFWHDNSTNSTFLVKQEGFYWVESTVDGCVMKDSINVYYNASAVVELGPDTILCFGEELKLDLPINNASFLWQDNSSDSVYQVTGSGKYWVEVKVDNCTSSDTIEVAVLDDFEVDLGVDTTLCNGADLLLDVSIDDATYLWNDNSMQSVKTVSKQGLYWVEVAVNRCKEVDSILVQIEDCDCKIFIPNAFTPNVDHLNEKFPPLTECPIKEYMLVIYNLWGEKIYESTSLSNPWDGTYMGKICQNGAYLYRISYMQNGLRKSSNGQVYLLR